MTSLTKPLRDIGFLTIALTVALAANFAYGQWANPTTGPVGANVSAPINVSVTDQTKTGNITAWRQKAADQMWSPWYCSEIGPGVDNVPGTADDFCVKMEDIRALVDGTTRTPEPTPTYSNCTLDGATVAHESSRRFYSRTSSSNCNSYDQTRTCTDGSLSGSNLYRYRSCSPPTSTTPPPPPPPPPAFSNCTLDGVTVAHGASRTFYFSRSSNVCSSLDTNRTCTNGDLSGNDSFKYRSCSPPTSTTITPPPSTSNPNVPTKIALNCNPPQGTAAQREVKSWYTAGSRCVDMPGFNWWVAKYEADPTLNELDWYKGFAGGCSPYSPVTNWNACTSIILCPSGYTYVNMTTYCRPN